ncbi:hypothetical protein NEOLEDRAFT_1167736, partial [Neolentinus lepideus HHB14362 ss-1]
MLTPHFPFGQFYSSTKRFLMIVSLHPNRQPADQMVVRKSYISLGDMRSTTSLINCVCLSPVPTIANIAKLLGVDYYIFDEFGEAVLILSTQFVMPLRVYAMYGAKRSIMRLLIAFTTAEIAWWLFLFFMRMHGPFAIQFGVIITLTRRSQCWDGYQQSGTGTLHHYRDITSNPLLRKVARESVIYLVIMFTVYTLDLVLYCMNSIALDQIWTGFRDVFPPILVNRLMTSVRGTLPG